MSDADLISRLAAFDRDGVAVAWTPEAVLARLVEAYRVLHRTPMAIGPKKGAQGFWPGVVMTWEDLVDDAEKDRLRELYAAYHEAPDWEAAVRRSKDGTYAQISIDRAADAKRKSRFAELTAAHYSRAEEAMRWPAVYLAAQPLLADAISTFSACRGLGLSLDAHMKERRRAADELIGIARARAAERKPGTGRMKTVQIGATDLTRQSLFPGRNFDTAALYERRKAAMAAICAGLMASRVVLRLIEDEPDEAVRTG